MRELIIKMANKNIGSLCLFLKNKKNKDYLDYLNQVVSFEIPMSEKVYYFVNDISSRLLCECGLNRTYIGFKDGYRPTCGNKECYVNNRKKTCIDKYGVDNPKKSKEIINKEKAGILDKWGGKHYMFNKDVRDKLNTTMINNWGVEWAQQSKEVSDKSKNTFNNNPNKDEIIINRTLKLIDSYKDNKEDILSKRNDTIKNNWNGIHYMNDDKIKLKIKNTFFKNYGYESPFMNKDIAIKRILSYKDRSKSIICESIDSNYEYNEHFYNKNETGIIVNLSHRICGSNFSINHGYMKKRLLSGVDICLHCNPILSGKSNMELELLNFIKLNYTGEILTNTKSIIDKEIDIYLPELGIAFEFNGLYWHSEKYKDKTYHLKKTNECSLTNIQLIHIWEDDWTYKKDIVQSIILNKLGQSNRIFARKCEIRIPDNKQVRDFLINNHIQGFVGSKVKIGLYFEGKLISLITFGNLRKSLGQKSSENSYELLRFCNKKNLSVIGGASKMLKYFLNNFKVNEIISYSDSSRSNGNLYDKLGFKFSHQSVPNYYYIIDGVRKHRFNFRKDKLVKAGADINKTELQIMTESGYYRIFDCGSKKWVYSLK